MTVLVTGRVVGSDGKPLPAAHIQLRRADNDSVDAVYSVGRDGRFRFRLQPGLYRVWFTGVGHYARETLLWVGGKHNLRLFVRLAPYVYREKSTASSSPSTRDTAFLHALKGWSRTRLASSHPAGMEHGGVTCRSGLGRSLTRLLGLNRVVNFSSGEQLQKRLARARHFVDWVTRTSSEALRRLGLLGQAVFRELRKEGVRRNCTRVRTLSGRHPRACRRESKSWLRSGGATEGCGGTVELLPYRGLSSDQQEPHEV